MSLDKNGDGTLSSEEI
jgi:calcium-dependent protein kinase